MPKVPYVHYLLAYLKAGPTLRIAFIFLMIYFPSVCSYHIAGTKGIYYAREPYSNVDAVHVTRFIGLASVGNKEKQVRPLFILSSSIYYCFY